MLQDNFQVLAPPGGGGGGLFGGGVFREVFWVRGLGGFIFGGAYTWMSLFSEFYGMQQQLVTSSLSEVETDSQSDVVDRVVASSSS